MADVDPVAVQTTLLVAQAAERGLTMQLIDPAGEAHQRARVYRIHLQPALGGGIDVVREWGRLYASRHRPRRLVTHHHDDQAVALALRNVVARRLRRGYELAPPSAL